MLRDLRRYDITTQSVTQANSNTRSFFIVFGYFFERIFTLRVLQVDIISYHGENSFTKDLMARRDDTDVLILFSVRRIVFDVIWSCYKSTL